MSYLLRQVGQGPELLYLGVQALLDIAVDLQKRVEVNALAIARSGVGLDQPRLRNLELLLQIWSIRQSDTGAGKGKRREHRLTTTLSLFRVLVVAGEQLLGRIHGLALGLGEFSRLLRLGLLVLVGF